MTQIGKNIKKIRNVKGLSQQAFADLFDLTRGNISSYEELRADPKIEVIIKIAKYFGIPLVDLVEKELSVNELLHYNTHLVVDTEKLKSTRKLIAIPYISRPHVSDYIDNQNNADFIQKLPALTVPGNTKVEQIAIEVQDPNDLPAGFDFWNGDILIFERITKENIHRITDKLGMMCDSESIRYGVYRECDDEQSQTEQPLPGEHSPIILSLNEWVSYPFNIRSESKYWLLQATFQHR
jgi:transcriptional regulator with XRE-family HTH domain